MKSNTSGNHTLSLYQNDTWVNFTVTPTWQRFQTTRTSGSALVGFFMLANNSTSLMPDILVYGAQLETGSGATSYIPTGSSTVTRNADDCLLTGTNFSSWYNPKEGSTFVQWTGGSGTNVSDGRSYTLLNTTQTNQIFENGSYGLNVYLSDFQAQIGSSLGTGSSAAKVASAFKQADFATSVNGSSAEVKTSGSMPTLVDRLSIGGNYLNAASYKFANFKQFTYYPIRLTNTQLKALTS